MLRNQQNDHVIPQGRSILEKLGLHSLYHTGSGNYTSTAALENFSLTKPHDLINLKQIPGFEISGSFNGNFFLFGGNVNGSAEGNTTPFLEFAWQTDPGSSDYYISQIPVEKAKFNTIDEEVVPTVRFEFDTYIVSSDNKINNNNPNDFIKDAQIAVFTLSEKDFGQLQK